MTEQELKVIETYCTYCEQHNSLAAEYMRQLVAEVRQQRADYAELHRDTAGMLADCEAECARLRAVVNMSKPDGE